MGRIVPPAGAVAQFHKALHRWYKTHGRHELPWRNTRDPYAIYLSEIMLQQTQVETVRTRFYEPFLTRFPTLDTLAGASTEEVLSAWQGLGYYRRAGHLHAAAKASGGALPVSVEGLMALPGIGRNTAHAVAAFAFNLPYAVMEANVKRIMCRIFALETPTDAQLWEGAERLLDRGHPFDYNQAMMDIGAMICTKARPKCDQCPANLLCAGKDNPEAYPRKAKKKAVPVHYRNIIVMRDEKGRYAATARTTRFLQGMYHFTEQEDAPPAAAVHLGDITQSYSHFTLNASVYLLQQRQKKGMKTYNLAELSALPMSMAEKKILQLLARHGTSNI